MKAIINKIKAIINRYNPLIYTRVIRGLVKDVKELETSISSLDVSQYSNILINKDNIEINKSDISCILNKLNNFNDRYKMLRGDINLNKSSINQLSHEAKQDRKIINDNCNNIDNNYITIENLEDNIQSIEMDYINQDQLHESFYDFKHQENINNDEFNELKKKVREMDLEIEDLYHDNLVYGDMFPPRNNKSIETATIKHLKDVLNNNKKHSELIEKLLNELCELNNLKEDK